MRVAIYSNYKEHSFGEHFRMSHRVYHEITSITLKTHITKVHFEHVEWCNVFHRINVAVLFLLNAPASIVTFTNAIRKTICHIYFPLLNYYFVCFISRNMILDKNVVFYLCAMLYLYHTHCIWRSISINFNFN